MNKKEILDTIKAFGMTNQIVTEEIQSIGARYSIDIGHVAKAKESVEAIYYPQFSAAVRNEAASMSGHYETFYCLEKTIRALVADTLEAAEKSEDWWQSTRVSQGIKTEVANRIQKEMDAGITRRSLDHLDYTTFGELSVIITSNWDVFGGLFDSRKAVEKVMANLNMLRAPIAHCTSLAEDEVLRLQLTVRDWFRLME
ncbi:Swt1 family HEPN domain-containing protein [Rhodopseudomonas sp. G2_2311]|uniref:Swt1 family HEPN domain-containing protein n=1 Tax=Rhodopseudomonas sp. G2_2311 TaxID=3114287 RepID=UPI0039C69CC0